jgi:hypothetical protein
MQGHGSLDLAQLVAHLYLRNMGLMGELLRYVLGGTRVRSKQRKSKELKTERGGNDFTHKQVFSPLLESQLFRN